MLQVENTRNQQVTELLIAGCYLCILMMLTYYEIIICVGVKSPVYAGKRRPHITDCPCLPLPFSSLFPCRSEPISFPRWLYLMALLVTKKTRIRVYYMLLAPPPSVTHGSRKIQKMCRYESVHGTCMFPCINGYLFQWAEWLIKNRSFCASAYLYTFSNVH